MGCTYAKLKSFVDKNLSRYKTATRKKNLSHIVNAGKFLDPQYKLINILLFIGCLRPLLFLNLKRRWWKWTLLSARLGFMPKKGCNYLNQTYAFQAYPNSSIKPSKLDNKITVVIPIVQLVFLKNYLPAPPEHYGSSIFLANFTNFANQAPVVQKPDNFILWISYYPTVSICAKVSVYPCVKRICTL